MATPKVALIIPVRNGEPHMARMLPALRAQSLQPDEILIIDSASTDNSVRLWREFGARVVSIDAATFNHGGTRALAAGMVQADVLIYMTQDAIPLPPDAFKRLVAGLYAAEDIGVAYGRQVPHPEAGLLARHARAFNYPAQGRIKRRADVPELGIKTCFSSDAFCAYRADVLAEVGGFPQDVIGSEDAHVAGRMLLAGYAVHYVGDAEASHSHDYSIAEEFRRYFDIGVFYSRESWIAQEFGGAGGEGGRFVRSELRALRAAGRTLDIPGALLRSAGKFIGYRLGHLERHLPLALKRNLGMFTGYWRQP